MPDPCPPRENRSQRQPQRRKSRICWKLTGIADKLPHMAVAESELTNPTKSPGYTDYSAERKAEVILLIKASGNITQVARDTGIPRQTLYAWLEQEHRYAEIITRKQGPLADKLENIAHLSADLLTDGRLASASVRELLGAIHITVPAMQLLRGEPTSITANVDRQELSVTLHSALGELDAIGESEAIDVTPERGP